MLRRQYPNLILCALASGTVRAQTEVESSEFGTGPTSLFLNNVTRAAPELLTQIINDSSYQSITVSLFLFCATIAVVFALKRYILGGSQLDLAESILRVSVTWVLMQSYMTGLWAVYEWQSDFGDMIQYTVLRTDNKYHTIDVLFSLYDRFEFNVFSGSIHPVKIIATLLSDLAYLVFIFVFQLVLLVLLISSAITNLFALWGFLIVGAIGFMLLPSLLFPPLTFLFDGWLRTLFTVLLYSVIARIVLSISVWGFELLLGPPSSAANQTVVVISGRDWESLLGCLIWAVASIAAMKSVMPYAQSIVSGAGAAMADSRMASKFTGG
ncbi:MAG: hypothetical protein A3H44_09740 [Gammaproteobacteria bacterium RIFCSPLOWO2_02_FULL_57_10]|nr:MAG: hypothetical protein A3H44_09740 [Gammaproteobacteria bacterium RIFCSPLOWO2_02_FULL_57_10]